VLALSLGWVPHATAEEEADLPALLQGLAEWEGQDCALASQPSPNGSSAAKQTA